jgi:hypothetical protein
VLWYFAPAGHGRCPLVGGDGHGPGGLTSFSARALNAITAEPAHVTVP